MASSPDVPTRRPGLVLVALVAAGLVVAWLNRFVQDDAFISFVYARALVEGDGPTWFGERVEGYTNFLWVLWIALGLALGASATIWSWLGGLAAFAAVLVLTWNLASRWHDRTRPLEPALAVGFLITNHSVSSYATGGLETMLQTALLANAAWLTMRLLDGSDARRCALLSLTWAAALMTRLDSAVVGLALLPFLLARRRGPREWLALLAPGGLLVGAWLGWKLGYYGELLPNTYRAKIEAGVLLHPNGLLYLWRFVHWYALWPFLLIAALAAWMARTWSARAALPVAWLATWCAYVVHVGGDFMEFRFMVPAAPPLALIVAFALSSLDRWLRARAAQPRPLGAIAGLAVLIGFSVHHGSTFRGTTADSTLDSIDALGSFYGMYAERDWSEVGAGIGRSLDGLDVRLALHAVGAIPYFSRIPTVDMWGLNDRWVARHGNEAPADFARPGHRRHASMDYLRERRVDLVIGHPMSFRPGTVRLAREGSLADLIRFDVRFEREPFGTVTFVEIPVDERLSVPAIYLTRTPELDRRIRERGWPTRDVRVDAGR